MELREQSIKDSLQNAEKVNQLADKRAAEYEAQLLTAQEKGKEIISEARKTAKKQSEAILQKAERDAEEKLEKSRIEIENEKTAAKKALKDEIGELALMAAGKILEEELDAKKHQAVVDDIMKNAEVSPWEK